METPKAFTFSAAFAYQEEEMALWKKVLVPTAYARLAGIQAARNERQHKSPHDVWRGQDITEAVLLNVLHGEPLE